MDRNLVTGPQVRWWGQVGRLKVYIGAKVASVLAEGEEEVGIPGACSGWWTLEQTNAVR